MPPILVSREAGMDSHVMWVPVIVARHIIRLWMEEMASRYGR